MNNTIVLKAISGVSPCRRSFGIRFGRHARYRAQYSLAKKVGKLVLAGFRSQIYLWYIALNLWFCATHMCLVRTQASLWNSMFPWPKCWTMTELCEHAYGRACLCARVCMRLCVRVHACVRAPVCACVCVQALQVCMRALLCRCRHVCAFVPALWCL